MIQLFSIPVFKYAVVWPFGKMYKLRLRSVYSCTNLGRSIEVMLSIFLMNVDVLFSQLLTRWLFKWDLTSVHTKSCINGRRNVFISADGKNLKMPGVNGAVEKLMDAERSHFHVCYFFTFGFYQLWVLLSRPGAVVPF